MKSKKNIKSIIFSTVIACAAIFLINISLAAETAKVNVETANLRESADSNSKILELVSLNQEVQVLEKEGEWYKVKVNNVIGYLRKDLLSETEDSKQEENNKEDNNQYENTNQDAKQMESDEQETNKTTENQESKKVIAEDTKLKIVPSINSTDIVEAKKDEEVTIIETMNSWICVQVGNTKGWVRQNKLKEKELNQQKEENQEQEENKEEDQKEVLLKTLFINTDSVNLRKEASTASDVIVKLPLNTAVDVYAEENGWSKVKVSGKEGYISSSLLSDKKQETSRGVENSRKNEETVKKEEARAVQSSGKGATVVETAKNYIGSKYSYGATGPSSFDCSGFTSYIFKQYGVTLSRTAAAQYNNGTAVSREQLQPGDLVMFGGSASSINHVGIYIGGGQIVHAANSSRGVTTDTINSGYYNNNYVGARRVM